jgi:hypothetical protein
MQAKKAAPTKADGAASASGLDQVEDWLRTLPTAGSKDLDEAFPAKDKGALTPTAPGSRNGKGGAVDGPDS